MKYAKAQIIIGQFAIAKCIIFNGRAPRLLIKN